VRADAPEEGVSEEWPTVRYGARMCELVVSDIRHLLRMGRVHSRVRGEGDQPFIKEGELWKAF